MFIFFCMQYRTATTEVESCVAQATQLQHMYKTPVTICENNHKHKIQKKMP